MAIDDSVRSEIVITTNDGLQLEAEIGQPSSDEGQVQAVAVVAHPHPLYGGTMANPVVECLFSALVDAGALTIRFNFRGVGQSEGTHGGGKDERNDILAAIEAAYSQQVNGQPAADLSGKAGLPPLIVAGYSFGADVALSIDDERIGGWIAVAPPLSIVPINQMTARISDRPKLILSGSTDEFRSATDAKSQTAKWTNTTVQEIAGANHFFADPEHLRPVAGAVHPMVRELLGHPQPGG